ncbi:MAG TPA: response regulator [Candidatus Omnitrophota bacterium]|jgi:CheY-like chemotaxis protein|nr:response regulator [Candidatus Omnitrophota bacterium]
MTRDKKSVAVIICLCVVVYGTGLLSLRANPDVFGNVPLSLHRQVLVLLFLTLSLSSLVMLLFKEWGRKIFLGANALLCLYLSWIGMRFAAQDVLPFILLNIVVLLFFSQGKIKLAFARKWEYARKSVLIVDDDEGIIKTVKGILLPNGFSVLTAVSGEKGIQVAKRQKPDLIILDVILPGIKGREVCATLKQAEETKNIPVLFLTAKDSMDDIHAELAAGATSHLTKPVHAKTLLAEVRRIFEQH